jgi:hypothetical protein
VHVGLEGRPCDCRRRANRSTIVAWVHHRIDCRYSTHSRQGDKRPHRRRLQTRQLRRTVKLKSRRLRAMFCQRTSMLRSSTSMINNSTGWFQSHLKNGLDEKSRFCTIKSAECPNRFSSIAAREVECSSGSIQSRCYTRTDCARIWNIAIRRADGVSWRCHKIAFKWSACSAVFS